MKIIVALLFAFLALLGCVTHVVSTNPRNVIVESKSLDAVEAQRLADIECSKYESYAKMTLKPDRPRLDFNYVFECVK